MKLLSLALAGGLLFAANAHAGLETCITAPLQDFSPCTMNGLIVDGLIVDGVNAGTELPSVIVQPTGNGLRVVGPLDSGGALDFQIKVPSTWSIDGYITFTATFDCPASEDCGLDSYITAYQPSAQYFSYSQTDGGNLGLFSFTQDCLECSLSSYFDLPAPDLAVGLPAYTTVDVYLNAAGGAMNVDELSIEGFTAIAPEPESLLLFATLLGACAFLRSRRSISSRR